jgi:ubiquinone/menaquinone biosynthesis C-methylase UbiE
MEERAVSLLRRHGFTQLEQKKILEVGCGSGFWLRQFVQWGVKPENLVGIDLLSDSIVRGKELCPSGISLQCGDANSLDFEKDSFDVVTQFTVFSSVLDQDTQANLADEICRVTKPEDVILWFDFFMSNPKNPDVIHLRIRQLFSGWALDLGRVILAPPIARFVAPFSPPLCKLLSMLKPLCTHYLGIIKKP